MLFKFNPSNFKSIEVFEPIEFKQIMCAGNSSAKEEDLEDLIAENVNLIESTLDEEAGSTLLIIGRQLRTITGRRMDLVAIDSSGRLILIEVKRDAVDVQGRKDHAEIQSVRYAASLAKLRTVDELVASVYGPYIANYCGDDLIMHGGGRTAEEWARTRLLQFLAQNAIVQDRLNHEQSIVLIGAGFDDDTISAAAWMAKNGLPIRMISLQPAKFGNDYIINVEQILPLPEYDDYFVDVVNRVGFTPPKTKSISLFSRQQRIRLKVLMDEGKIAAGDMIYYRNEPEKQAKLTTDARCEYKGQTMSVFEWGKLVSGWSSLNIYEWVVHVPTKSTLEQLRCKLEEELGTKDKILESQ